MNIEGGSADDWRSQALAHMARKVPHDRYVWGTGDAQSDGTLLIDEDLSKSSLGSAALEAYNKGHRYEDVLGRLHVARPGVVLVWSEHGSPSKAFAARDMKGWLGRDLRIAHLLLAGTRTSRGRAWVTFYRLSTLPRENPPVDPAAMSASQVEKAPPFTREQVEYAGHAVPFFLLGWLLRLQDEQRLRRPVDLESLKQPEPSTSLTVLTPYEMAVLLAYAETDDTSTVVARVREQFPDRGQLTAGAVRKTHERALAKLSLNAADVRGLLLPFRGQPTS